MPSPRLPYPHEIPRLHAFLPAPAGAHYLVATARSEPSPERIVAAAAWWPVAPPASPDEPAQAVFCCWHVAPRWEAEGQTLPAELLNALVTDAGAAGATQFYTTGLIPEESPFTALLTAGDWTISDRNVFFEGRSIDAWNRLERIYQRFSGSEDDASVTARLRVALLTPNLFPAIRALVLQENLVPDHELTHRLNHLDQPEGWSRCGSIVLLTNDPTPALAAVVLVRLDANTALIDAQAVDREVCTRAGISVGAANVFLLRAGLASWQHSGGGTRLCFRANSQVHRQTANFARRCGAEQVRASCTWQRTAAVET